MPQPAVNAVYYPSWKVYKGHPPSSLQVDAATHILYAFVRLVLSPRSDRYLLDQHQILV